MLWRNNETQEGGRKSALFLRGEGALSTETAARWYECRGRPSDVPQRPEGVHGKKCLHTPLSQISALERKNLTAPLKGSRLAPPISGRRGTPEWLLLPYGQFTFAPTPTDFIGGAIGGGASCKNMGKLSKSGRLFAISERCSVISPKIFCRIYFRAFLW